MAIVYFTNNASAGLGSLAEAIKNASPGDVIRPDESVFERGSTIEIKLASQLTFNKNLTLDGGSFRVVLDGGSAVGCLYITNNAIAEFTSFDFVRGKSGSGAGAYVASKATATFNRCLFAGCDATWGGAVNGGAGSSITLNDCAVVGCRGGESGGGVLSAGALVLNGVTAVGCVSGRVSDVSIYGDGVLTARNSILGVVVKSSTTPPTFEGCVVDVVSSTVGFVASPPDDLTVETWDANAWQSWDLHLFDDASGAPSPYRDSGDVGAMSRYDLEGNFRGRETNGVATCSPGAYETIQADLFWIGEPFPQEMVDLAPQNARVSDLELNPDGKAFNGLMTWEIPDGANYEKIVAQYSSKGESFQQAETLDGAAASRTVKTAIKGDRYILRVRGVFADGSYTAWSYVDFVASDVVDGLPGGGQTSGTMLPTELSAVPSFLTSDGWATSRFATAFGDVAPQAGQTLFINGEVAFGDIPSTSRDSTLNLVVGGGANVSTSSTTSVYWGTLTIGASSIYGVMTTPVNVCRVGAWARLTQRLLATIECEFDANAYVAYGYFYISKISPIPVYGQLAVAPSTVSNVRIDGVYVCDAFKTTDEGTAATRTIKIGDGATIRAKTVNFKATADAPFETLFDKRVTVELQGNAKLTVGAAAPASWADAFAIDVTETTSATLTLNGQTVYGDAPTCAVALTGSARIDERGLTSQAFSVGSDALVLLDNATLKTETLTSLSNSRFIGCGKFVFPANGRWINENATLNGVAALDYDVASNDIKIVCDFDASEILGVFSDGGYRWTSQAFDAGTLELILGRYILDANGKGDYRTIYDSTQPVLDSNQPVYETAGNWNGAHLKTIVHATPEAGWNYYRVEISPFVNLGGAKIYHKAQTTRYFVLWNADYEPERTYYYVGGATGSFAKTSDWSFTHDGVAKFEGVPQSANATFVVPRSTTLGDCPNDHFQISVVFPSTVDVYDGAKRRLSDAEARLISVGVPTPSAPEFYVGQGGTSGFWTQCDGATLYRVEALDGSATGLTVSNRWLDAKEIQTKTWRVRVAAPIYGGVEKWSAQRTAVQPFSALVEKPNYDDATSGTTFELVYSDDFDGVRDASITRLQKSDKTSTILTQNFDGGEFTDAPETLDEYVYRVSWTPSPENVWLEATAAPWFVADGFDAKTQTNFITSPNRAYETPTFAARIAKKSTGELLKRQDVAKISYTLFETSDRWATRAERLAVGPDGSYWRHNVEIPAATVRDSLLVDPNFWSLDEIGANFVFSPEDGRPFFPSPGAYLVRATLETTNARRIVVEFPTQVE